MKVLYVIGSGSKLDNLELRWSLRSIEKHAANAEVIIAGQPPEWLDPREATLVHYEDRFRTKHKNILDCILRVIDDGYVTGEFLYSSDDHFFVKDVDFDDYPVWINCEHRLPRETDFSDEQKIYSYRRSLIDTRNILEESKFDAYMFHGHYNTHMHALDAPMVKHLIEREPQGRYGYEPTDLFMNVRIAREGLNCTYREDLKLRLNDYRDEETLLEKIGIRDSFSIYDEAVTPEFQAIMDKWFPVKSRFEL